jgi:hypothetical protein
VDVCCDLFLSHVPEIAGLVVIDRELGHYRWGRHAELLERPPALHIQRRLPPELAAATRSYSLRGDALDLLSAESNGEEVDWHGDPLPDLLRALLPDDAGWAFVFEWHCDQIDYVTTDLGVEALLERLRENLDWSRDRKGFISVHPAQSS